MRNNKLETILTVLQIVFYLSFVVLWFKGNFPALRPLPLSPLLAFIPLIFISAWKLFLRSRPEMIRLPRIRLRIERRTLLAMVIILCFAFLLRLPYLSYHYGLLNSDAVIFCLEGKHIAEGKVPPICSYGQLYLGTLPGHFFALVFKLFGYSTFAFKLSTFILYIPFVIFHFFFLQRFFPFTFALIVSLFYFLPLGYLVPVSMDGDFIFPLFFLLGLALIYLAFQIAEKKREKYIAWVGFLAGLTFWANALSVYFTAVAIFLIFLAYKFKLKVYLKLFFSFLIGFFPQLLLEINYGFFLTRFLSGKPAFNFEKIKKTADLIASLITFSNDPSRLFLVYFLLLGFIALIIYSLKTKQLMIIKIYILYIIFFFVLYFSSVHSDVYFVRYLYPLLFVTPLLFLSTFLFIKGKAKYLVMAGFIIFIFVFFDLSPQNDYFQAVKESHLNLKKIASFLEESGHRYWRGDFWTSYLLTAITGEKVIIGSTSLRRYYPYELEYFNNYNGKENFIFLRGEGSEERRLARTLLKYLDALGVKYEKKEIADCWLIYNIETDVAKIMEPPASLPRISSPEIEIKDGFLRLHFKNLSPGDKDIAFSINVEIQPFSKIKAGFSLKDEDIICEIPFPPQPRFKVIYYLDYWGTKIPESYGKLDFALPEAEAKASQRPPLVYLYGLGAQVNYENKQLLVCEKEVGVELNEKLMPERTLSIVLYSPFKFSQLYWYGHYFQEVDVLVNGELISRRRLNEGQNVLTLTHKDAPWKERHNILTLSFKYHFRFGFTPRWNTAALLEKIEIN